MDKKIEITKTVKLNKTTGVTKKVPAKEKGNKTTKKQVSQLTENNKKIPLVGGTIKTKDKYLPFEESKVKELKEKRWLAIIDKNTNKEIAVVRLTDEQQKNTTLLKGYKKGNKKDTYFKHFVEIFDVDGKPIVIDGEKFVLNDSKYNLDEEQVKQITSKVMSHCKQSQTNRDKIKKLKARGDKK